MFPALDGALSWWDVHDDSKPGRQSYVLAYTLGISAASHAPLCRLKHATEQL